jgi:hypothetical protein
MDHASQLSIPKRSCIMNERPLAPPRDPYVPGGIGQMRASTPVAYEHRVSAPYIVAGVAAVIGLGALGAYWYKAEHAHDQVATATMPAPTTPPAITQPETPGPTAPTAQDLPETQPQAPLTKEKEQNSMPLANHGNNHSSESLDPKKAKAAPAPKPRTTASRPAAMPKMEPAVPPPEPLSPLTSEPPAPVTPPKQADTPTPPPVQEPPKPIGGTER